MVIFTLTTSPFPLYFCAFSFLCQYMLSLSASSPVCPPALFIDLRRPGGSEDQDPVSAVTLDQSLIHKHTRRHTYRLTHTHTDITL